MREIDLSRQIHSIRFSQSLDKSEHYKAKAINLHGNSLTMIISNELFYTLIVEELISIRLLILKSWLL